MSLTQSTAVPVADRQTSPGLGPNLSSNNPFRAPPSTSPALPSPANPRPVSRNPFLASFEDDGAAVPPPVGSPRRNPVPKGQPPVSADKDAKDLFHRLTLRDEPPPGATTLAQPRPRPNPNSQHRPSSSSGEPRRRGPPPPGYRPMPRKKVPNDDLDILASPERRPVRPRRNSESSVMERPALSEEDRRRRERRRREYEARKRAEVAGESKPREEKDGDKAKDKDGKPRSSRRKAHGLDLIDKLDVTGVYGAGLFHHDGPFDACNPHRNRKRDHRAPMQAFPANSANMAMSGAAPKEFDHARFHGITPQGFSDYGTYPPEVNGLRPAAAARTASFDPTSRTEPVHGEESLGLGTSTFLEGAPASKKAMQRRESETDPIAANGAATGLTRKKSLAQRIRGMSGPKPRGALGADGTPLRSPGLSPPLPSSGRKIPAMSSMPLKAQSAAPSSARSYNDEENPFDTFYDDAGNKKSAGVKTTAVEAPTPDERPRVRKPSRTPAPPLPSSSATAQNNLVDVGPSAGANDSAIVDDGKEGEQSLRARALSSPRRVPIGRRGTGEDAGGDADPPQGGGLLSRMKSFKGKKSTRLS